MSDREAARTALREHLTTRRGRITPGDAGLPSSGRRRVTGLRREEVAMLAGISPEYYIRLERGTAAGVSAEIVDTVATALRLDGDERVHLDRLIAALTPAARRERRRTTRPDTVGPGVRVVLEALQDLPAVVFNGRLDIVAVNALGRALYDSHYTGREPPNAARFLFLDEDRARLFWPEWDRLAEDVVAILRVQAGLDPEDPALVELIGQLSTRSEQFRTRWAANDVRAHRAGVKILNHPLIGRVALPAADHDPHRRHGPHRDGVHPTAREPRARRAAAAGQLVSRPLDRDDRSDCRDGRHRPVTTTDATAGVCVAQSVARLSPAPSPDRPGPASPLLRDLQEWGE